MTTALAGLLTGFSLIIAIGAQNAFVLRQGIRREHVLLVVTICAVSDALLIAAGTLGIGFLVTAVPWLLTALKWVGAAYLVWFAIGSFRSAANPSGLASDASVSPGSVALTTLALTYLNPHVYLDTVIMLGNLANQHGEARWQFAVGAMTASLIWFTALGFGARALAKPLGRPSIWRGIDIAIGLVMLGLAGFLALS